MKQFLILIFLTAAIILPNSSVAGEMEIRKEIQQKVQELFQKENFDELDQMAKQFLEKQERTTSGVWKSTIFSTSLTPILPSDEFPISQINQKKWDHIFAKLKRWLAKSPESVAAQNFFSFMLDSYAWSLRGGSWAEEVPEEAWPLFYNELEKANKYMESVKDNASIDPFWYVTKINIMKGLGRSESEVLALADEGLDRYPTYYQLYFIIIDYLFPKWYGDKHKIEQFADESVERTQNTEGMGIYARIYWAASQYNYGTRLFTESDVVWPKMKAGIKDVIKKYPDSWNLNNFAHFSCLAKDREMTRELMLKIKSPMIDDVWKEQKFFDICKKWSSD